MSGDLSCSFSQFSHNICGVSPRYPGYNAFFPLHSCIKDIKSHLRQVKLAQSSVSSEKDLILWRAGLFDEDGLDMTICPKHRCEIGLLWKPSRKCQHPLHGSRNCKPERGINKKMSKEIMLKWKVLVQIGSGMNITQTDFTMKSKITYFGLGYSF